jgi:uroporphyrin-3 C-methyltransferase
VNSDRPENGPETESSVEPEASSSGGATIENSQSIESDGADKPVDKPADLPNDKPARGAVEKPAKSSGGALAAIALVVSLIALGGSAWLTWTSGQAGSQSHEIADRMTASSERQDKLDEEVSRLSTQLSALELDAGQSERAQLQRRLENLDATSAGTRQQLAQIGARQTSLASELRSTDEAVQSRLLAMESSIAAVAASDQSASSELDLDEVDYLLRLASERLQLFSDTPSAALALKLADRHLEALDSPLYIGVRQTLSLSLERLESSPAPDLFAITRKLDELQAAVMRTPFKGDRQSVSDAGTVTETGWWARLKGVFSGLVTVKRQTEDAAAVLSLEDKDLVRQGLWLQFETARLALMRGDQAVFAASLRKGAETIDEWFEASEAGLDDVRSAVLELSGLQISPKLPDISAPWSQLRQLRSGQAAIRSATATHEASRESAGQAVSEQNAAPEAAPRPEAAEESDEGAATGSEADLSTDPATEQHQ